MVDGEMVAARLTAARELGVEVVAPHTLIRRAVRVAVNAIVR
jgi:hypothetical protein